MARCICSTEKKMSTLFDGVLTKILRRLDQNKCKNNKVTINNLYTPCISLSIRKKNNIKCDGLTSSKKFNTDKQQQQKIQRI